RHDPLTPGSIDNRKADAGDGIHPEASGSPAGSRGRLTMPTTVYAPPALEPGTLRVTPLGGLGEVGRNMTVFEYEGKLLVVDCGVLFPEEHQPGVDLILPDFEPI